jgi:hypothetical protein
VVRNTAPLAARTQAIRRCVTLRNLTLFPFSQMVDRIPYASL